MLKILKCLNLTIWVLWLGKMFNQNVIFFLRWNIDDNPMDGLTWKDKDRKVWVINNKKKVQCGSLLLFNQINSLINRKK